MENKKRIVYLIFAIGTLTVITYYRALPDRIQNNYPPTILNEQYFGGLNWPLQRWSDGTYEKTYAPYNKLQHLPLVVAHSSKNYVQIGLTPLVRHAMKRASPNATILVSYFDWPYIDAALNFYETSLNRQNISNFIFAASDARCCELLNALDNGNCIAYRADPTASMSASTFGSKAFIRKMNIRTDIILELLDANLTVLHSDIDVYYLKNPFTYINCANCDIATLVDHDNFNAGFVYVRPTEYGRGIYGRMKQMVLENTTKSDQVQMNLAIKEFKSKYSTFEHVSLPTEQFLCGKYYFEDGNRTFVGDNPCEECVVVHNNFIVSKEAKEYRAKETGLWNYDGNQYFSSPSRKYITFDNLYNIDSSKRTNEEEKQSLQSALAIAMILNRTLILPAFHCGRTLCSMLSYYRLKQFCAEFSGAFREHSFLKHYKVPNSVKTSRSKVYFIATDHARQLVATYQHKLSNDVVSLVPKDKINGATADEIVNWLSSDTTSIIQFHSLYKAFSCFKSPTQQKIYKDKITNGLKRSKYLQA